MDPGDRCLAFATASGALMGCRVYQQGGAIDTFPLYDIGGISPRSLPQPNAVPSLVHAGSGYMLYLHGPALLDVLQLDYPNPDESNQASPLPRLERVARYTTQLGNTWPGTSFQLAAATIVGDALSPGTLTTIPHPKHPTAIRAVLHCRALHAADGPSNTFRREFVPEGRVPHGPARPPGTSALPSHTPELGNLGARGRRSELPTTFYTALVDLDLVEQATASWIAPKNCLLRHLLMSTTIPQCVWFAPGGEQYCIGTTPAPVTVVFQLTGNEAQVVPTLASPSAPPIPDPQPNTTATAKAPYIWMQTESDVTVCYELPERIDASQLSCTFNRLSVTLTFEPMLTEQFSQFPTLNRRAFFAPIVPNESFWTLEKGRILTLYLQKMHEKTRWAHVFRDQDEMVGVDHEVLETLDPSEFVRIQDRMEKYTTHDGATMSANSNGTEPTSASGAPAPHFNSPALFDPNQATHPPARHNNLLAQGVSPALGPPRTQGLQRYNLDDSDAQLLATNRFRMMVWNAQGHLCQASQPLDHEWLGAAFAGASPMAGPRFSVCLRVDIDGLVYQLGWQPEEASPNANVHGTLELFEVPTVPSASMAHPSAASTKLGLSGQAIESPNNKALPKMYLTACHTSTFSAFGYVQAAKPDRKLLYYDGLSSATAHHFSSNDKDLCHPRFIVIAEARRYLYVYFQPVCVTAKEAPQTVVDLASLVGSAALAKADNDALDILGIQQIGSLSLAVLLPYHICTVNLQV
ncbi:hypothetical protein H4R34_002449 [Dimargaris verticillata]|uniref:NudC domain-containing protein 1 n=1 Tax=Dimargaris verticillata TaxID=2761393 RepID=A0A9W8ECW3_9FUNG|nr:hypothetical protein H4R34_002449 [Dimargaris verticillata]